MNEQKEYKGHNGDLILTNSGVIIKRGAKGFLLGGGFLRGDKTIPYSSIIAVQFKKAGMVQGYIQLTLKGGNEAKSGWMESLSDENTINFNIWGESNKLFLEAKKEIENRISGGGQKNISNLDELEKLAVLKEKNIITKEEFETKKKSLLDL